MGGTEGRRKQQRGRALERWVCWGREEEGRGEREREAPKGILLAVLALVLLLLAASVLGLVGAHVALLVLVLELVDALLFLLLIVAEHDGNALVVADGRVSLSGQVRVVRDARGVLVQR